MPLKKQEPGSSGPLLRLVAFHQQKKPPKTQEFPVA